MLTLQLGCFVWGIKVMHSRSSVFLQIQLFPLYNISEEWCIWGVLSVLLFLYVCFHVLLHLSVGFVSVALMNDRLDNLILLSGLKLK